LWLDGGVAGNCVRNSAVSEVLIKQLGLSTIAILTVTCKAARFTLYAYGAAVNPVAMELPKYTVTLTLINGMKS